MIFYFDFLKAEDMTFFRSCLNIIVTVRYKYPLLLPVFQDFVSQSTKVAQFLTIHFGFEIIFKSILND